MVKEKKILLGTDENGKEVSDYLPAKKRKKRKTARVKPLEWGYGFSQYGEVNVSPFAACCSEKDPTPVVIIPLKDVKRMCKALGIKFEAPIQ